MATNSVRPGIRAISGYTTWGEQPDDIETIKLNTNENPYPASPKVDEALAGIRATDMRRYPQPTADPLRDAIAAEHGLVRDNVVVTNGGDEALRLAITTYIEPGASFGMAEPRYSLYPVLAAIHAASVARVALRDDWQLPIDFADQLNQQGVQLTCVVNPHAPSGTLLDAQQLSQLANQIDGVLLIDEAYADFIDPDQHYQSAQLLADHDNLLILRTFSKGYSLAGLRLGYLLGSDTLIAPIISKTRDSYNIDYISQTLGLAAFTDQAYARNTWQAVRKAREHMSQALGQLGLTSPPSQSNFLLARVPESAPLNAEQLYQALKQADILVRFFDTPDLKDRLRITIGTPEENSRLLDVLTDLLT